METSAYRLTHSLFRFILSYPVKVMITFLSFNSLVFNLLLGLEVLTFLLYPSIVASFFDHRPRLNIHSSPIPFKHGVSNKMMLPVTLFLVPYMKRQAHSL